MAEPKNTTAPSKPILKKVELLNSMSDGRVGLKAGTVIEVPEADADRMIEHGAAIEADENARVTGRLARAETAAKAPAETR